MSVQTQIDRISGNVSAALSAIADKGVTVPEGSTSDALAGLIASIEAGGGGGNITAGTITATNSAAKKVEHGLGAEPQAVIFFTLNSPTVIGDVYDEAPIGHLIKSKNDSSIRWFYYRGNIQNAYISESGTRSLWGSGTTNSNYDRVNNINDTYFMTPTNCDAATYAWIVFKEALI